MKIIIIYLLLLYTNVCMGQISTQIKNVNIANHITDIHGSADVVINVITKDRPRGKLIVELKNNSRDTLNVLWHDNPRFFVKYKFKNKEYEESGYRVGLMNTPGIDLAPDSTYNVEIAFSLKDFPTKDYMSSFFDIIPTLQFVYKREDNGKTTTIVSDKINWEKFEVKPL